jgi:putative membrane protein
MRSLKDYILLFLKGMGMGGADIIPGVSGGTIAFITGIYEELLDSIKSFDKGAIQLLLSGRFADFWKHINGKFLIILFGGIFMSILSFAKLIHYLLNHHPIELWSFFFGLIIISALLVTRQIKKWSLIVVLAGLFGIVIAYFITSATPATTPDNYFFIFISGAVAICAMILPGISGSFILLILGKYEFIIESVKDMNLLVILVFGIGCAVGLLSFSRFVSWLLHNYHNITVALLAGFMLGSLNKIWPWKETLTTRINSKGEVVPLIQQNISPIAYMEKVGEPLILNAILFFALGILIIIAIEKIAQYTSHKH